jgi:hypothetical protein
MTIDGSDANEAAIKSYNAEHGTAIVIRQVKDLNKVHECVQPEMRAHCDCTVLYPGRLIPSLKQVKCSQSTRHAKVRRSPTNGEKWRALC